MGNPKGFREFDRELPAKKPVAERLNHYEEFIEKFSEVQLHQQSSRCMNCGIPFCHNGCPLGNLIPDFNEAVHRHDWKEAYEILNSTNNFPEFTGRICPAPCESACVLGINQAPVAIEEIEKHVIEIAFEKGFVVPRQPNLRTGKKVAVIGSGPAGLAAACQLNYAGHQVTVFERDDKPGGLLRYGIPDFKLEKWVVERRISLMEEEGVMFRCNAEVGRNESITDLLRESHAVVLAIGSTVPGDLLIPGRELQGVHFAMDFLKQQNQKLADSFNGQQQITATGKHVVVIGGGDTGSDCVGTANRQMARTVTQLELLPRPPEERNQWMPWPNFPMILRTSSSHEEGCGRQWAVTTKEFIGDGNGQIRALKLVGLEWNIASDGKPEGFSEIAGTEKILPCELALLAIGFRHPQHEGLLNQLEVELDEKGNASAKNYQTNLSKVFVAGDMRRGQSLVVWAINEGRECARKVDEFLGAPAFF